MKIPKLMAMLAPVILAAGCETTNRQPTYSSQTTHGAEVISSPGYPTTYYTNSSYYPSTYPPVYTDKSVTQGAAAANQTMNETDRALAYSIQQEFSRHTDLAGVAP